MPKSEPLLLGMDIGTTELKMAVFGSRSGVCRAVTDCRLPVRVEADGTREQDAGVVLRRIQTMSFKLRRLLGTGWRAVEGIGLATQGGSAIIADAADGRAYTPMQLWNDSRPLHLLDAVAGRRPNGYWRRLSRLDKPGAGLARMQWMQEQYPGCLRDGRLYVGIGEFVGFHMTGFWRQDPGNAIQMGCYSVARRALAEDPLTLVGLSLRHVAPLRQGHEKHPLSLRGAKLLSLPPGLPFAGPYIDHEAGYLSAAGVCAHPLQCSLGTAWVGSFVSPRPPGPSGALDLVLPSPVGTGRLVLRVMRGGNATWDWAKKTMGGAGLAVSDGALLPPDGVVSFPWLTVPNPNWPGTVGNGSWQGLGPHVTAHDLIRAAEAGLAFEFRSLFDRGLKAGTVDGVVLSGGASRSDACTHLMAGLFHPLPVWRTVHSSVSGARGSVYVFSPRTARAPATRVCPPSARLRERIHRQYAHYREMRTVFCRTPAATR